MDDYALWGGYDSLEDFQVWERSGHVTLPYGGAWRDQPWWVRADFLTLLSVARWYAYNEKLPKSDGLKNLEDVA